MKKTFALALVASVAIMVSEGRAQPPVNDSCAAAIPVFDGVTSFSTVGADTDGVSHPTCEFDGQTYQDIWYEYTATCSGEVTVSTCSDADYDTDLVVYDTTVCTPQDEDLLDCNDDTGGCAGFTSEVTVPVVAGNSYLVRVGGWLSGDEGSGNLTITCNPLLPTGACCLGSGSCAINMQVDCEAQGGVYQGDDTVCGPGLCPQAHVQCYEAKTVEETPFEKRTVLLTDQFGSSDVLLDKVKRLCTPVDKNGEGIVDETAHLTCYNIKEATPEFQKRIVGVDNQFGPLTLKVEKQKQLCVPSEKNGVPSAPNRDHYECYQVKVAPDWPAFEARDVDLSDQFTSGPAIVEKPLLLCNPVEKVDESGVVFPIVDPEGHFVCYELNKQPKLEPKPEVTSLDQFGELTLTVVKSETLCVPSTKTEACEQLPFPECGGPCPNPEDTCRPDPATGVCTCEPIPCDELPPFQCGGGDCPEGTECRLGGIMMIGEGNVRVDGCSCQPISSVPCEASGLACDGFCPAPLTCIYAGNETGPDLVDGCICAGVDPGSCGPFPDCHLGTGYCPPGYHCGRGDIYAGPEGDGLCRCVPDIIVAGCGDWPSCGGGVCPTGGVCENLGDRCGCVGGPSPPTD